LAEVRSYVLEEEDNKKSAIILNNGEGNQKTAFIP
jgi:hypothetical protein